MLSLKTKTERTACDFPGFSNLEDLLGEKRSNGY